MTKKEKAFENIVGKEENAGNQHFLLFPTMFSILSKTNFNSLDYFFCHLKMLLIIMCKILFFAKE